MVGEISPKKKIHTNNIITKKKKKKRCVVQSGDLVAKLVLLGI